MKKTIGVFLLLLQASIGLRAAKASPAVTPVTQITLGQAVVVLNGPWKFHIGDNPAWADPNFDDSGWQDYTIDSKRPKMSAVQAMQADELAGWQQHGHPGYTGYAWYRIRLKTPQDAHSLALLMPQYVDDAYEVYIDGQKIGSFGRLDKWHVLYPQQSMVFPVPAAAYGIGQPAILAIRFWNQRYEALPSLHNLDGGLRGVPLLGPSALLQIFQQSVRAQTEKALWPGWLMAALYGAVGVISLFLFLFSRDQREYLWAGISLTTLAVLLVFETIAITPETNIPLQFSNVVIVIAEWVGFFALSLAAMYLLGVPRLLWRRANYAVMVGLLAQLLLSLGLRLGILPPSSILGHVESTSFLVSLLAVAMLLLAIAIDGLRTLGKKAWLLLMPGLLTACGLIGKLADPSPSASFDFYDYFFLSVPLAVLVIFLMRFTEQQRENIRLVGDVKQAQEVQQVLIPEDLPQVAGFRLAAVYRPAQQVGGDFFQILSLDDGGLLVIVGDVSGKGTRAAMLVAVIVGAVRAIVRETTRPDEVLTRLNTELQGRMRGGFATCLAARISPGGAVTLANAGHLGPYVSGAELEVPHDLPLGVLAGVEYSACTARLPENATLVLLTDGVVEAQDKHGKLFGFDRTLAISGQSAEKIATAAQTYGQKDDITVVTVQRVPPPTVVAFAEREHLLQPAE